MNLGRALSITGWMTDPELTFLATQASKSKVIVEAGCFQGRSTRAMADNTDGIIHAVDPWKLMPLGTLDSSNIMAVDEMTYTRFAMNLNGHIESGKVIPHAKKFVEFHPPETPDFIFIDAMHDYENVKRDILHAMSIMKSGLLAGHDYQPNWQGVIKAVKEIFGDTPEIHDTIWSIKL